jgi:hypothetical protein
MSRLDRILALVVSAAALAVYALTLTPSLSYLSPDGSELATVPYVLGLAHSPGYPLYTWLGFLFSHLVPLGDVAFRINLMSAVMGALAAGGLYAALVILLPEGIPPAFRRGIAALAALLLAFSKTFWAQSLIAEVYAPNALGIALTLLALLRWDRTRKLWDFFLFALVFGLSLGLHLSDLGFAPAFILFILLSLFEPAGAPTASTQPAKPVALAARLRSLLSIAITGLAGFALGAAQFAWLPLQSSTLIDRAMLRSAPTTLQGIYSYTLGAFSNMKFAFALPELPGRLVIYLDLARQQFGLIGIGLGILGLFSLLARRTRHFFLLVGMYLVQIWFFIQYSVFDLDVFFIPAHMLWAVFIGFGLFEIIRALQFVWNARVNVPHINAGTASGRPFAPKILPSAAACLLILLAAPSLAGNWAANDFSGDTAVNDFYAGVWGTLPQNAALITPGGVFGYDAFYWQLAYGTRSDVLLPLLPGPNPARSSLQGRDLFATTRAMNRNAGPGALPENLLRGDLWTVPILFGQQPEESIGRRETLVLYRLTSDPPPLLELNPQPQFAAGESFGPVRLIGYDISSRQVESGAVLNVKLYWRLQDAASLRIETRLGGLSLEQHEIGFGLLARYARTVGLPAGSVIADSFGVIVPSGTGPGPYALTIRPASLGDSPGKSIELCVVDVINETGTMERWLQIAGS